MKKQNAGNSRLFFIEFLIVLFFFLIISTICLKVFVQAHRITTQADDLSHAQTMAASAAELLLAGYDEKEVQSLCQKTFPDQNYTLQVSQPETDIPETSAAAKFRTDYALSVYGKDHNLIYELTVTVHLPQTGKKQPISDKSPVREVLP